LHVDFCRVEFGLSDGEIVLRDRSGCDELFEPVDRGLSKCDSQSGFLTLSRQFWELGGLNQDEAIPLSHMVS
jgi:hypothetical protein